MQISKFKQFILILFIVSLIPGDTFYGNLGIAQSYFVVPLIILYVFDSSWFSKFKVLNVAAFVMISILTFQLVIFSFNGLTEWYRTSGGIVLTIALIVLYWKNFDNTLQLKWIVYASSIPVVAFYLGFWTFGGYSDTRGSFLLHDPNHLAHILLYGTIGLQLLIMKSNLGKQKIIFVTLLILWFFPILFTISRTAIIIYFILIIIYLLVRYNFGRKLKYLLIIAMIFLFSNIFASQFFNVLDFEIIDIYYKRFNRETESRINYYEQGIELIKNNWVTGVGISNFQNPDWRIANGFSRRTYSDNTIFNVATSTHNGFVDIFLIGGIFLFISFLIIVLFPSYYITFYKINIDDSNLKITKYLVYALTLVFVLSNMTYSLYNSKIGWWGIALSYLFITKFYLYNRLSMVYHNKLENKVS